MDRQTFSGTGIGFLLCVLCICTTNAQNLVVNGGFEYSDTCSFQSLSAPQELVPWVQHHSSPDYYHPLGGGVKHMFLKGMLEFMCFLALTQTEKSFLVS